MSIHKRVLRVTDEADEKTRAYAETHEIGVYDAATALIMAGLAASKQGAVSEPVAPVERITALALAAHGESVLDYSKRKGIQPADALEKLLALGIKRAKALDNYKASK